MALPDAQLGANLKAYFDQGYTSGTGTLVDAKGNATSFTQATAANRPAWNTSTAPSGRGLLSFDGVNDVLNGGNIPTGVLPAWSASSVQWVEFAIFVRGHASTTPDEVIIGYDGIDYLAIVSGGTYRYGCYGDSAIGSGTVERWIGVHDPAVGFVASLINGVVQSDTETPGSAVRSQWVGPKSLGAQSNGGSPFTGLVGCIGYAVFTSTITISDLYALDACMQEWWTTAPSGGGITCALAAPAREERAAQIVRSAGAVTFSFPTHIVGYDRSLVTAVPSLTSAIAAGAREERSSAAKLAVGAIAPLLSAPAQEERSSAIASAPALATALPAPTPDQKALPSSLVTALTAALSASPAEERSTPASCIAGDMTAAMVGVGSSAIAPPAVSAAWTTAIALAPAPSSELGLTSTLSRGAITMALAAAIEEQQGGTVTYLVGGPPPAIVASLAAPPNESHGLALAANAATSASMAAGAAEERGSTIARQLAGVVVTMPSARAEETHGATSSSFVTVVDLPAPQHDERGGFVAVTFADAPVITVEPTHRSSISGSVLVATFVAEGPRVESFIRRSVRMKTRI